MFINMMLPSDYNLPSLEEFKKMLVDLSKLDLSGASIDDIEKEYLSRIPFFPRMFSVIHLEENYDRPFYRVRLNIDPQEEDLTLIRTYSYPSTSQCKFNGRANRKGKSVFYCSNNAHAAIIESKPKVGDVGYLSIWKNNIKRPINTALYLQEKLPETNEFVEISKGAHEGAYNYFKQHGKDKFEHFIELNNFIVNQFVNEPFPYTLTSYLSNGALYRENPKDLIIYPSFASDFQFCNFAFHPNIVDCYLSFQKVIRFQVTAIKDKESMNFALGRLGEIVDSRIIWRKAKFEEVDIKNFL
jgi:hypothetical protein